MMLNKNLLKSNCINKINTNNNVANECNIFILDLRKSCSRNEMNRLELIKQLMNDDNNDDDGI